MNRKLEDRPSWTSPGPPSGYPHTHTQQIHSHAKTSSTSHILILFAGMLALPFSLCLFGSRHIKCKEETKHTAPAGVMCTHNMLHKAHGNVFAESINSSSDVPEGCVLTSPTHESVLWGHRLVTPRRNNHDSALFSTDRHAEQTPRRHHGWGDNDKLQMCLFSPVACLYFIYFLRYRENERCKLPTL